MRLIEKSISRNLFESLKEDKVIEAINAAFDGTDFAIDYIDSIDDFNVTVGISALSGDGQELSRDVNFEFSDTSYDTVYNVCEKWIEAHNSPELFYESVVVNAGSTIITSDERGVTIEDNGNVISTDGNTNVNVTTEIPIEMPVDVPVEEPTEDASEEDIASDDDELTLDEANERYAVKKIDEPVKHSQPFGVYDTKEKKYVTQGTKKVCQASADYLNNKSIKENATEDFHGTTELARQVFVSLQKDVNGKYLVMNDGTVTEEIEASDDAEAIEKFNQKYQKLEDDNLNESATYEVDMAIEDNLEDEINELLKSNNAEGIQYKIVTLNGPGSGWPVVRFYGEDSKVRDFLGKIGYEDLDTFKKENIKESEQSVDIFKNPEFDYKITDITVLQPTDSGDVRAIDMNDILVGLDEALTERYCDANYVKLNSILTKCGKDYDSAILEVSFPGCKGYLLSFESAFNQESKIYECNVREATTSKKIEHLCVKSQNPIKAFENAIVDLVNMKTVLNSHESLSEDIDLITHSSNVEDNNGVIYTNDKRVEDNIEKNEKRFKKVASRYKKSDKFKVEEEPDQKNTQGEEVDTISDLDESTKLNEAWWKHELACGTELRRALDAFDESDVKTAIPVLDVLMKACDEAKQYVDEYDANQLEGIKDDAIFHKDIISDPNFDENEDVDYEPQEEIDYILDKFYDICDANKIWVKLNESDGGFITKEESEEPEIEESDEAMAEDVLPKAIFHRKPKDVDTMIAEEKNNITVNQSAYKIVNTKELSSSEFEEFANNLLANREWLKELYVNDDTNSGVFNCIEVTGGNYSILVDPSGYDYARYAAILNNTKESEETEDSEETEED